MNEISFGRPVASGTILPSVSVASEPLSPNHTFFEYEPGTRSTRRWARRTLGSFNADTVLAKLVSLDCRVTASITFGWP